ncbi:FixH family protein [Acuticoccus mangrovi]|uniref:FixH family protein n=1 Tax=Acuticoccus mangrovi TaxID=2796142 RepID=A0A934IRT5_9HYPH|nr:FixH family protein [Acuticoccus mangrovi]
MKEFTGRHMLIIMLTGFGIVIAVNFTMAYLASASWTGLVAKNGYVASIDFAREKAAQRQAEALGWDIAVTEERGRVSFTVESGGEPVYLSAVDGTVEELITGENKVPLGFTRVAGGRYRADSLIPAGERVVRIHMRKDGDELTWRTPFNVLGTD